MSKSAVVFLLAALACVIAALLTPIHATTTSSLLGAAGAVFGVLFLGALVIGRRFKFDPLLR